MWVTGGKPVRGRAVSATGDLGPALVLSPGSEQVFSPLAEVDTNGRILLVWSAGSPARVVARSRSISGALGPIQTISPPGPHANLTGIDLDGAGRSLVVWKRHEDQLFFHLEARSRSASGALGPVTTLTPTGHKPNTVSPALSPNGKAVVAWQLDFSKDANVQAVTRDAAGKFGDVRKLSVSGEQAYYAQAAIDADGDTIVAWTSYIGTIARARARVLSKSGQVGPLINVSSPSSGIGSASVAVVPGGAALFVWSRFTGSTFVI